MQQMHFGFGGMDIYVNFVRREIKGKDEEWVARQILVERLEKRAAKIELENERNKVARALSLSYHDQCNNGNGNGQSGGRVADPGEGSFE